MLSHFLEKHAEEEREKTLIFFPQDTFFIYFLFIFLHHCIKTPQEPEQLQNLETLKAASLERLPA